MFDLTHASIALILLACACTSYARLVELSPDGHGDRIAAVNDNDVVYHPAKRVNIGAPVAGGGACRYIKQSRNGDLYVTGPALGDQIFRSTDGGHTWTKAPMQLNAGRWIWMAAFTILRDDTFLMLLMPSNWTVNTEAAIARSNDLGKTWSIEVMKGDLSPYKYVQGGNADFLELTDGTLLVTVELLHAENFDELPAEQRGLFEYVFRSPDGGRTWPVKSMITMYGAETHLLQLPSGKVMACIRKQRWHRQPGDPASVVDLMKQYGWTPDASGGLMEGGEGSNRIKNMFVSESYDGGYTWVNERQVTPQMKCSGDLTLLKNGTLVLQYLHRYNGPIAGEGIRARISHDQGRTWEPEEYILSEGTNYPGGIALDDGGMITICPHSGQTQAVHWRPPAKDRHVVVSSTVPANEPVEATSGVAERVEISVITVGQTTTLPATRVDMVPPPPSGVTHAAISYGRNGAILQRAGNGDLFCMGNIQGPVVLHSRDQGKTWHSRDLDIDGWGSLVAFKILTDDSMLIAFEPTGGGHRCLYTGRSTDQGRTWLVRSATLDMHPFKRVSGQDTNMLELPDGTLLLVLQLWGGESGKNLAATEAEAGAYVLRSTDGGKTWGRRSPICGLVGKARMVRLRSGKLLACVYKIRSNQLMLAESEDDGRNWTNPRPVATDVNPGGETGNLTQLTDGTVVLQFLYDATTDKNPHLDWYEVSGLRAITSHDEGQSWRKPVYVIARQTPPGQQATGQGAYLGDSVELADGGILTACVNHADTGMRFHGIIWRPAN